jgi:hypothetical protein
VRLDRPRSHTSAWDALAPPPDHTVFNALMASELRNRVPDTVPDDVELFEDDGDVYGRKDGCEFRLNPMAGASEPPQDERLCGVPLRDYEARYGEIRYCTAMKVGNFPNPNYEHDEYCRNHQGRHQLMERAHELFEHGYFATNYVNFAEKLDAAKFLFAVEMVGGLFEMSRHEFDIVREQRVIDTSDSDLIQEDAVAVELPIPQEDTLSFQANELWMAALDEVKVQNMQEVVFTSGMSQKTLADSADMEGQITDTKYESTEHHLHLPISRLTKDIKEHLQNGGVAIDGDESGAVTFQKNDYTLDVSPDETDSDAAESVSEVSSEFTEQLEDEGVTVEVGEP